MNFMYISTILMTLWVIGANSASTNSVGEPSDKIDDSKGGTLDCSNVPGSFYFHSGHDNNGLPVWVYKFGVLGDQESIQLLVKSGLDVYANKLVDSFAANIAASIVHANERKHEGGPVTKFAFIVDASRISPSDILLKMPLFIRVTQTFAKKLAPDMAYGHIAHAGFFAQQIIATLKVVEEDLMNRLIVSAGEPEIGAHVAKRQLPKNMGGDDEHRCLGHFGAPKV